MRPSGPRNARTVGYHDTASIACWILTCTVGILSALGTCGGIRVHEPHIDAPGVPHAPQLREKDCASVPHCDQTRAYARDVQGTCHDHCRCSLDDARQGRGDTPWP